MTLEGDARLWCSDDKLLKTYAELTEEFVKHFSGITSYESNLQKFRTLKWNKQESLEMFKNKLLMLKNHPTSHLRNNSALVLRRLLLTQDMVVRTRERLPMA